MAEQNIELIQCKGCDRIFSRPHSRGRIPEYCDVCKPKSGEEESECRVCGVAIPRKPGPGRKRFYCDEHQAEKLKEYNRDKQREFRARQKQLALSR